MSLMAVLFLWNDLIRGGDGFIRSDMSFVALQTVQADSLTSRPFYCPISG